MRKVILESPYAGEVRRNVRYARAALKDSLQRGEAPIASHLLYTQRGILNDADVAQRRLGMQAGLAWAEVCDAAVFYADYGFSAGMLDAMFHYGQIGKAIEVRYLNQRGGGKARQREARDESAPISPGYGLPAGTMLLSGTPSA